MIDFLDWLGAAGGARRWLLEQGVPEQELAAAEASLLVP
jgi:hypothetical protein